MFSGDYSNENTWSNTSHANTAPDYSFSYAELFYVDTNTVTAGEYVQQYEIKRINSNEYKIVIKMKVEDSVKGIVELEVYYRGEL